MTRGRPRATDHLDAIAQGLAVGLTLDQIADQCGLTRSQVKGRITTMRQLLAEALEDTRYISARKVNNVQLGQAWIAHRPEVSG